MQEITADNIGTEPLAPEPATDTNITGTETAPTTTDTEQQLTTEVIQLWAVHSDAQNVVKRTQQELKLIRENLGARLHALKGLLARPGRAGKYSSFLEQHGISRTTADRLVAAHAKKLNPDGNSTTDSIPELTDEEITELAKATWKKLERKLGTKSSVYKFLAHLMAESGLATFKFHRGDQHGLALVDPDAASTPQATAATTDASAAAPTNAA